MFSQNGNECSVIVENFETGVKGREVSSQNDLD